MSGPLSAGIIGDILTNWKRATETGLAGWGGRIRTSEWRNQNPLPYHLATPQSGLAPGIAHGPADHNGGPRGDQ